MRVVGGSLKSRTLRAPKGSATRPTTDRVRESLFSVLGDVGGLEVLDLYSGTGALAIEALSRGAARAVCVESARPALAAIAENRDTLGLRDRMEVVARKVDDALEALDRKFDLVFADPPWADVAELPRALAKLPALLADDALVCIEHASRDPAPVLEGLAIDETRAWGDTAVTFYRASS